MKNFFNKEVTTNIGFLVLFSIFVVVSFLTIPIDRSSYQYEDNSITSIEKEVVDITKEGVHENASPDESCRVNYQLNEREVLVDTFSTRSVGDFNKQMWLSESKIRSVFPDIQSKLDVGCLYLKDRGVELFSQKKYKEGVWLDEGSICISMARFCGITPIQ